MSTNVTCDFDEKIIRDGGILVQDLREDRTFAMGPAEDRNFCNSGCLLQFILDGRFGA